MKPRLAWSARRDPTDETRWVATLGDRQLEVVVAAGPDRLSRLEAGVLAAFGAPPTASPTPARWGVRFDRSSGGGLFELEVRETWTVVDLVADQPRWEFTGSSSHDYDGVGWSAATGGSGCDEVVLGGDGRHVLARTGDLVESFALEA